MSTKARHYPDWKAPSEDGKPLIWPAPTELIAQTRDTQRRLASAYSVKLQNVPLPQVRRQMRQFVGHDSAGPLVATGHQAELSHPGVWVKNVLIDALAEKLQGRAIQIAVDTDAPKHLHLRWPGASIPITQDAAISSAAWSAMLAPPSAAHLDDILARLSADSADWGFQPLLPGVLESLKRSSADALDLPSALTSAVHELDWQLGLRHHSLMASPIWSSAPFMLFSHDLLARAEEAAAHYNVALHAYREENGISSRMRPMPDLFVSDESIEVPFWLDDLHTGRRARPSVFKSDRGYILELIDGEQFVFDKSGDGWESAARLQRWLSSARHRLSPRALTLTMFFRLAMVDQFVHGIGGARYDQVTDRLIESHYGIEAPAFAVTTATLYFPAALGRQRVCVPCIKREGHRLKHSLLGSHKRELVEQIQLLPRRSTARAVQFHRMHDRLASAAKESPSLVRWQEQLEEARVRDKQEQAMFDRELHYAIQPRNRLEATIHVYGEQFRSQI